MAYDKALADRVRDIFDNRPYVYEKTMFGGPCWFAHGNMAAAVLSGGGAMIRVGDDDFTDLVLEPGAEPMVMGGRESKTWLRIDEEACASDERLREWIERGLTYAESLPRKSLARPVTAAAA
ncbi:TfoX/Sxy family protein [Glycomyces luteolus]|uniref:TfoX/Sxy family protein n=1 Tax=Glycomyces luteolus TaxID=2670330 RepID=A0A9X3SPL0_9ACTN|nr:TfoX/Sxy family protein [Glycomyces luteolus]MDA1359066.1 TfoX/Sxy family protein [Glycomyces luteolus]